MACCIFHLLYTLHSVTSSHDRTAKLSVCVSPCSHRASVPVTDYIYSTVPQKHLTGSDICLQKATCSLYLEIVSDCIDQKLYLEVNYVQNIFQCQLQLWRILSLSRSFFCVCVCVLPGICFMLLSFVSKEPQ